MSDEVEAGILMRLEILNKEYLALPDVNKEKGIEDENIRCTPNSSNYTFRDNEHYFIRMERRCRLNICPTLGRVDGRVKEDKKVKLTMEIVAVLKDIITNKCCSSIHTCENCQIIDACKWVGGQINYFESRGRKCANERCGKMFYLDQSQTQNQTEHSDQKFCSGKCAGAKRTREYRKRLKSKLITSEEKCVRIS